MFDQHILKDIDFSKGECRLHKRGLSIDKPGENLLLRPLCSDDYEKGKCCIVMTLRLGPVHTMKNFFCFPKKSVNRKAFSQLPPNFKDAVENIWRPAIFCQGTKSFVS